MTFQRALLIFTSLSLALGGCGRGRHNLDDGDSEAKPIGAVIQIAAPLGLPALPIPAAAPETVETIALGRQLFYEKRLSMDNTLACASCHNPLIGFSDGRKRSTGVGGKLGIRNAPSIVNAAYVAAQFWDGRAHSLEEQAGGPMANSIEMNQPHEVTVSKLAADSAYRRRFNKAFGDGPVTISKVTVALSAFERTLVSGNSPFDQYEFGGKKNALTPAAVRGLAIFRDPQRGNCSTCHTIDKNYALFTDGKFHNLGVGVNEEGELTDFGRYPETKQEVDRGAFKTPTLRNVALTSPYMHDGSLKTLKDVVDFYAGGGNSNPSLDKQIKAIRLSGPDRADLVEFLKSLTGEMPPNVGPPEGTQMGSLR